MTGAEADEIQVKVMAMNGSEKRALCQQLIQDVRQNPSRENRLRVLLHLAAMGEPTDQESDDLQQQVWVAAHEGAAATSVDKPASS